ncbi:hypothetical protein SRABI128_01645 [Microbacterium sp. Bi128]|nr:hypothetical protein SRABI128_01645 [Microbacterium sp. Bi128]
MASTICSVKGFEVTAPKPTETDSSSASGATPIMPRPFPVPREAASEATQLPWLESTAPTGVRPSAAPTPDTSVPAATAPENSTGPRAIPVSMTAIFWPAPRVVFQASRMPYWSSQYSAARTGSVGSSGTGPVVAPVSSTTPRTTDATAATTRLTRPLRASRTRTARATTSPSRERDRRWGSHPTPRPGSDRRARGGT